MAVNITKVELVRDADQGDYLTLEYRLPDEMVPHTDPAQAKAGKSMNHDASYAGHQHHVSLVAIAVRMAMYGYTDPVDALEEAIHETVSKGWRSLDRWPSKADLRASRGRHPVGNLRGKLQAAGIVLDVPGDEQLAELEEQLLRAHGRAGIARVRGVPASSLPDPARWANDRQLTKRLPKGTP